MPRRHKSSPAKASLKSGGKRRRGYGWKPGTDENIKASGKFAVRLVQHLISGTCAPDNDSDCDIWHEQADAASEVKLSSSRDSVKIREEQLDAHIRTCASGFPCASYWYAVVKYDNYGSRLNGGQQRLFQDLVRSEQDLRGFLGPRINGVWLIDISVIDAVRRRNGTRAELWRENGLSLAVPISRRFLDQLHSEPGQALHALGINSRRYLLDSCVVETLFEGISMEFCLTAAVKSSAAVVNMWVARKPVWATRQKAS